MSSYIRIEDVRDIPGVTIDRAGKMDKQIIYLVNEARRYSFTIPDEDYTPEKAMERIRADERERMKIIGETFVVDRGG